MIMIVFNFKYYLIKKITFNADAKHVLEYSKQLNKSLFTKAEMM